MILPLIPVLAPLFAAAILTALNRVLSQRWAFYISWVAAAAAIYASAQLMLDSYPDRIVYWFGNWQPRAGVALGISFVIGPLGAGLALLAGVLVLMALVVSCRYFDTVGCFFHVLIMVFLAAMSGFSLTGDLFNLFVFFELMSAAAFALCGYKSEEPGPLEGALNFAVVNTVGAFLVLCGIGLLYGRTGALNMAQAGRSLGAHADGLVITSFLFIASGFFAKAAIVPFHFWLADAHTVAPTPVCILFSGVMVELGLYAVARVYWVIFREPLSSHDAGFRGIFIALGILTAVAGSLMCYAQRNLKRLLAFSTIGHMGIMLIGFALLSARALAGTAMYVAGHGLIKGALFVYAGILLNRFGSVDEFELHGRGKPMRVTGVLFAATGLALAGLPPAGIFRGSDAIEAAARSAGYGWITAIDLLVGIFTGGAVLRVAARVFAGWGPRVEQDAAGSRQIHEERETTAQTRGALLVMTIPAFLMTASGFVIGVIPGFEDSAGKGAAMFVAQAAYWARVLGGQQEGARGLAQIPSTVSVGFAAAGGAVLLAAYTIFAARGGWESVLAAVLNRTTGGLRSLHSGVINDYVVWFTLGVAAIGAASVALLY
ncbi:MAG TPA: proton-conducting transporter membrane subunit [Bryobacteraceae bacterium]